MSKFNRTGIDWCGWSWNPIVGCMNQCGYCYARLLAKRLNKCPECAAFTPHFHMERMDAPENTKIPEAMKSDPRMKRVFLGSMTDLFGDGIREAWIVKVADVVMHNPQWEYLILTKYPERIAWDYRFPAHCVRLGFTADGGRESNVKIVFAEEVMVEATKQGYRCFVSCEPLIGPVEFKHLDEWCSWLIVGPRSHPLKHPEPSWVHRLMDQAKEAGVPVWTKDKLLGEQLRQEPKALMVG